MDANLDSALKLILARVHTVETELEHLRETVREIKDEIHEAGMGGTN